jgi:acetyl esterase/lipase
MLKVDTSDFDPAAISAETAAFNAKLEAMLRDAPKTHEIPPEITRQAREEGRSIFPCGGPFDGSDYVDIPGGRIRITRPEGAATGVFIHIHGGGWVLGAPHQYDHWAQYLAREVGCVVASIPYRLAPEHRWPAQGDDVELGVVWVVENAASEFGTDRIVIGGESAGAHLSAVALGRLKRRGMLDRICGALLHYGLFDPRMTPSMAAWGARQLVLSTPTIQWFQDCLIGGDASVLSDPDANPMLADLGGMPPALFQCGTADPLIDDTLFMAARWVAARSEAEVRLYPGGVHAFDMFGLAIAQDARSAAAAFLRRRFSG